MGKRRQRSMARSAIHGRCSGSRAGHLSWDPRSAELSKCRKLRLFELGENEVITKDVLPEKMMGEVESGKSPMYRLPANGIDLEEVERSLLVQALEMTGGNRTQAAKLLGLTRRSLGYRMEKYRIEGDEDPKNRSQD